MSRLDGKFLERFFVQEVPLGTVNGSNVTFTLSQTPQENDAVLVFVDDLLARPTTHYTLSGTTITFGTAPATGQSVFVFYIQKRGE